MSEQQHSIGYIIGFAASICLVCSVIVSGSAVLLEERQEVNKVLDRQKKVLTVAGLMEEDEPIEAAEVSKRFAANIVAKVVELDSGDYAPSIDVTSFDQRKAAKDPERSEKAPANKAKVLRIPNHATIYQVVKHDQVKKLILPVEGKGLWSTLYGFIALESDLRTIAGLTFYEHGETPGLGGEVDNPGWKALWKGRKAFDAEGEVAIEVIKGAAGPPSVDPYKVDGLSGATITARGVTHLIEFWLGEHGFGPYLNTTAKADV